MNKARPLQHQQELTVPAGTYPLSGLFGIEHKTGAFSMDRYPVTNKRFAKFVDEGGYDDFDLWSDEGWAWRLKHHATEPRWWENADPQWSPFCEPDRPVVGVSWFEAAAFCRFLDRHLPTEIQWEIACRGLNGHLYPWGDEWQPGLVTIRGEGPRLTRIIGTHPQSRGPFGHDDLVGNVWQWTTDAWPQKTHTSSYAVRGGAWSARSEHCRSDHRNAYPPQDRWSHVGFRTVLPLKDVQVQAHET
jgi:gamma-glutamyl hercynylcysteine S-oxide synthase